MGDGLLAYLRRIAVGIVKQAIVEHQAEESDRLAAELAALLRKAAEQGYVQHREARQRPEDVS